MKEIEAFKRIAADPSAYAAEWKASSGGRIIGFFCTYAIEEIIHAAGALPFRIFGTRDEIRLADSHLQAYCCSLVRGGLEDALAGRLSFLDGTVFPHTCDSIQRLSDIWRLNAGIPLHIDVVLPVKLDAPSSRDYFRGVVSRFRRTLAEAIGAPIDDDRLRRSIILYNEIRTYLEDIYRLRSEDPARIKGSDILSLLKASMAMDREACRDLLRILASNLAASPSSGKAFKRIVLAGGICNQPDIFEVLEAAGAAVVWDDLCTGSRYFEGLVRTDGDPAEALADRYAERIVCPAKHSGVDSRGKRLLDIVRRHRADGVIFIILKFCDPHSFDYPYLKECLDAAKVPSMLLEIEENYLPEGQVRTRLESFIEMI